MTFKVGDKVTIIDYDEYKVLNGKSGIIKKVHRLDWYEVEFPFENSAWGLHSGTGPDNKYCRRYFSPKDFSLIKETLNDPEYEALLI